MSISLTATPAGDRGVSLAGQSGIDGCWPPLLRRIHMSSRFFAMKLPSVSGSSRALSQSSGIHRRQSARSHAVQGEPAASYGVNDRLSTSLMTRTVERRQAPAQCARSPSRAVAGTVRTDFIYGYPNNRPGRFPVWHLRPVVGSDCPHRFSLPAHAKRPHLTMIKYRVSYVCISMRPSHLMFTKKRQYNRHLSRCSRYLPSGLFHS